jgi:acetylornithine/N-succinyldiaminopimelate aminotransferase
LKAASRSRGATSGRKAAADRIGILSFEGSFHGRTLGGINAGAQEKYREGFGPRLPGFRSIAWEDVEALKAEIVKPDLAAVVIEPVQGEGGVREAKPRLPAHAAQAVRRERRAADL